MSNKIHSFIFFLFLLLFITAAPIALLYSEGYRFDFDDNEVIKTGGLAFKVKPQVRARVYLDGELKKKVSGWTYSTYINALEPDNYKVKVQRKGFHPWQKTLKVRESKVTEAKQILMVPKEVNLSAMQKADSFSFSPDKTKLTYKQNNQLEVVDLEEDTKKQIEQPTSTIVAWGPESERILISASGSHFVINDQETFEVNLPLEVNQIEFNPQQPSELFYNKSSKLLKLDYTEEEPKATTTISDYLTYDLTNQGIFWLSPEGKINHSDFTGELIKNSQESIPTDGDKYKLTRTGEKTLILKDENLYFLTEEDDYKQIASNVKELKLSPSHQKVVLVSNHEINVIHLNEQYGQPQREKLEKVFINRFSQPIEKVSWFDSYHLIFNLKGSNKIKISGIDDRSQINMVDYLESNFTKWVWNNNQETFYLLKDGTIYQNSPLEI